MHFFIKPTICCGGGELGDIEFCMLLNTYYFVKYLSHQKYLISEMIDIKIRNDFYESIL
jgi:hypothetical protein